MSKIVKRATKLTLVFINFLFVAVGVTCMAVGGWVLIYREEVRTLTLIDVATKDFGLLQNAAILLITSGLVLFILGFVGCCAAYKDQQCLQAVYIGLVILCCIVTICACVVAFVFKDEMEEKLLNHLETKLKTEYQGFSTSTRDFSQAWDYAQVEFQCCGIQSMDDFQQAVNWTVRNSAKVPLSCCVLTDRNAYLEDLFYTIGDINCAQFPNSSNTHIDRPCYQELKNWMNEEVTIMGGVAIASIMLQVLAIVFIIIQMRLPQKNTHQLYRGNGSSY